MRILMDNTLEILNRKGVEVSLSKGGCQKLRQKQKKKKKKKKKDGKTRLKSKAHLSCGYQ